MKKTLVSILAVMIMVMAFMTGCDACTPREQTLKIYNWGEYMDETVVDQFEEYYYETYGVKINVVYREFGENEEMLTSVEAGDDWDLVCPSDYMIDRMITNDLAMPLEAKTVELMNEKVGESLLEMTSTYDGGEDGNYYSVPYIWGTFGIMFNTNKGINQEDVTSWSALFDGSLGKTVSMKDSVRDSYAVAILYAYKEDLDRLSSNGTDYENEEYREFLEDLFTEFSEERMAKAEEVLKAQKNNVYYYEGDNGKMDMADNKGPSLGLYWSCDAGFSMNEDEYGQEGNKDLGYYVPDEGSNVWIDGWVIPTTAVNPGLANEFIRFTLKDDIAELNSEYAGASSANYEVEQALYEAYAEDDEFFAGTFEGFKEMYLEMRFPSDELLSRCAVMGDFGDMYDKMNEMFENVLM